MEISKVVTIPNYWTSPKYSLGQRIKQGIIVGIQYRLPNNLLAESRDGSWQYTVQVSTKVTASLKTLFTVAMNVEEKT